MNDRKKIFKKFGMQTGALLIGAAITWATFIGVGLGMKALFDHGREQTERAKEFRPKSGDQWDQIEALAKRRVILPELFVEGGKQAVKQKAGELDCTGISGMFEYTTNHNKLTEYDTELDYKDAPVTELEKDKYNKLKQMGLGSEEITKLIKEHGLPDNLLTKDIIKTVSDVSVDNTSSDADPEKAKQAITEVVVPLIKDSSDQPVTDNKADEVKEDIKKKLNDKDILEDQRIIDLRKRLNRNLSYKKIMQRRLAEYKQLQDEGYRFNNPQTVTDLERRLGDIDNTISGLTGELGTYGQIVEEIDDVESQQDKSTEIGQESSSTETGQEQQGQEQESVEEGTETEDDQTVEDTTVEEQTEEETTQQQTEEEQQSQENAVANVTLKGKLDDQVNMTLYVDLVRGEVSGDLDFPEDEYGTSFRGQFSGTIDLSSGEINASGSGVVGFARPGVWTLIAIPLEGGDNPVSFTITGQLSEDYISASGNFSGDVYGSWSATRI